MRVVGFVGPSGTGKSHRSLWVAKERGLDLIIDDGLLIRGNSVIAGKSAKKEATKIGSVKCAVFQDDLHAREVSDAIKRHGAEGILILGTSDNMVNRIAERLGFGGVDEIINITDVASEFEIQQALTTRHQQGMHVIPVPTLELKKDFSGYLLDPLQILKRKGLGQYQLIGEKSVVRPTFSYMGNYTISDYTIYQIAEHVTMSIPGVNKIARFIADAEPDGVYMEMDLVLVYGYNIRDALMRVKKAVTNEIESLTAMNVKSLLVVAKSLVVENKTKIQSEAGHETGL